jgi:GT2 family glycosyltransferase
VTDVTILVATYGEQAWEQLAKIRAIPSAQKQGIPVIHRHGASLHEARNACLHAARTTWVVHLDADDELEEHYVTILASGSADVRAPSVRYVKGQYSQQARVPTVYGHSHMCMAECLLYGNWIVVGALARRQLLLDVGGWRDFSWSEDWDLWLRCHLAGGSFETIPQAVYRAHIRPGSRNRSATHEERLKAHRAIAEANGVPAP